MCVWSNKVNSQVLHYFIMSNVSRNFFIYSALPTQIFLDLLYVVIAWSLDQHKKTKFRFCCIFSTFTNISSRFTLLQCYLWHSNKTSCGAEFKTSRRCCLRYNMTHLSTQMYTSQPSFRKSREYECCEYALLFQSRNQ